MDDGGDRILKDYTGTERSRPCLPQSCFCPHCSGPRPEAPPSSAGLRPPTSRQWCPCVRQFWRRSARYAGPPGVGRDGRHCVGAENSTTGTTSTSCSARTCATPAAGMTTPRWTARFPTVRRWFGRERHRSVGTRQQHHERGPHSDERAVPSGVRRHRRHICRVRITSDGRPAAA